MPFETTEPWDMPLTYWAAEGSYLEPISPPLLPPNGGELVCIPPINKDWIKIILGCLDQLRIPKTWKAVDRADLLQALNWMQELKDMVATAGPCCDISMRLTQTCGLQYSKDGGTTWIDVSNWGVNFCPCVSSCIVPPVPPNPGPSPVQQHACNIAGYLAQQVIEICMEKVVAYVGTTGQQLQFAQDVMATIAFAFPLTSGALNAFVQFYNTVTAQVLSEVEAVRDSPTFWSDVTCAIFQAIKNDGYVTASNKPTAGANIAGISFPAHAWAVPAVAAMWNDWDLTFIQELQNTGAMDDVDCSACANTWCIEADMKASTNGWTVAAPGVAGVWAAGIGWQDTYYAPTNIDYIKILSPVFPHSTVITDVVVFVTSGAYTAGGANARDWLTYAGGVMNGFQAYPSNGGYAVRTKVTSPVASGTINQVGVQWAVDPGAHAVIDKIQITGNGLNPFGGDTCTE